MDCGSCYGVAFPSEYMADPSPSPPCDWGAHVFLVALAEDFLVGDFPRPEYSVDFSETGSVEGRQPGHVVLCPAPAF